MNDDMWMQVVSDKQKEIDALRDLIKRLRLLTSGASKCCYCGTESPHAKACEEALQITDSSNSGAP